ncbi:hypothetical protein BGZ95_004715, partial [Linnemannia exigua]
MTLQSPRPLHALDLSEIRVHIALFLPRRRDLYACMLVSRGWYLDFVGPVWNTVGIKEFHQFNRMESARLVKYGRHIAAVESQSEADFKVLQHPGICRLESLTVALPRLGPLARELVSDLVRRCRTTLRRVSLQGPSSTSHQNSTYRFDINTLVPELESRLEEVHLHNIVITREGFSNFLRGSPNLGHLRLNNVCIATHNSSVNLFTESNLKSLVCTVAQVMDPTKGQFIHRTTATTTATSGTNIPSLLVHFPALQDWTVELGSGNESINLTQLHQDVVQYTPRLCNIQVNDASGAILTELLARVFLKLETCILQHSQFTSASFLGLLQHQATLTSIHIQLHTRPSLDSDPERLESMRSTHLILRVCKKLQVLSIKGYEVKIDEFDAGEWVCKDLKELRVTIYGLSVANSALCLSRLQELRNKSRGWRAWAAEDGGFVIAGGTSDGEGRSGISDRVIRRLLPLEKLKI